MSLSLHSKVAISGLLSVLGDANLALACLVLSPELRIDFDAEEEPRLQPAVRDTLEFIYRATLDGDADQAGAMSDRLFAKPLSDYESAHAYQAAGHVFAERWDLPAAAAAFENGLELGVLPERDAQNLRYNLGKLRLYLDEGDVALDALQDWFDRIEVPSSDDYRVVFQALQQADRGQEALRWSDLAIEQMPEAEDDWRYSRLWLQLELGRHQDVEREAKALAATSPEDAAGLVRFASAYGGGDDDAGLFGLLEWAWLQGWLAADQQVHLASLYLERGEPYRAAVLLERGLYDRAIEPDADHWLLLAESWLAAEDVSRALEPLRNAAERSGDPDLYARLGRLHLDLREWRAAEGALRQAVAAGSREARLLLCAALFMQARFDEARAALAPPPPAPEKAPRASGTIPGEPCLGIGVAQAEGDVPGARVAEVHADSPAETAGLEPGDIVVQYNARQVQAPAELWAEVGAAQPGEGFGLLALRSDRYLSLRGNVGERPDPEGACRDGSMKR